MSFTRPCDRCDIETETALDLACFAYLCSSCWGTGPGTEHMCQACAAVLDSCACGHSCPRCRALTVGVVPQRQRESVA